ncbi:MAG: hypothetical protein HGA80_02580 [Candidatus Omnitrophica bacterium]|nr:hypothetical protein [Candidatus Omnitrophota bacterium]
MTKQMIRVYQHLDFEDVKAHTLEYGALSGICSKCKSLDVKLDMFSCPKCGTHFKYISFQNVREHLPKILRIQEERHDVHFLDYQDYKRIEGELRARSILG